MNRTPLIVAFLATCAMFCSALLLLSNLRLAPASIHTWLSSIPLAAIGAAYAVLQIRLKPDGRTLAKRLLLAGTFILWAVDQFLPAGRLATLVGDIVVSAYVLDLFWIIQEQKNSGL
jgi:hypothetical protein